MFPDQEEDPVSMPSFGQILFCWYLINPYSIDFFQDFVKIIGGGIIFFSSFFFFPSFFLSKRQCFKQILFGLLFFKNNKTEHRNVIIELSESRVIKL